MRQSLYFQLPITFPSSCCHYTMLAFSVLEAGEISAWPSKRERPVVFCIIIAGVGPQILHLSLLPSSALVWDSTRTKVFLLVLIIFKACCGLSPTVTFPPSPPRHFFVLSRLPVTIPNVSK